MKQNLTEMVKDAKRGKTRVLLVGFLIPVNYGPEYRKKFEQAFHEVAKEQQIPEVPFLLEKVALDPARMQDDGLHPNQAGQPIILDNVWVFLKPMIRREQVQTSDD